MTRPIESSEQINMQRRMMLRGLLMAATGAALVGCVGAPATPPRRFYLGALEQFPENLPKVDWSLVVEPPQTVPALRTNRIALAFAPQRVRLLRRCGVG